MGQINTLEIRCQKCETWFRCPIEMSRTKTFDTSTLIGNTVLCPHCGTMTECNKENMNVRAKDGGFVGSKT